MLTKINNRINKVLPGNPLEFLSSLNFHEPLKIKQSPGIEVWKARKFAKNYYLRIIENLGAHSENVSIETSIHAKFHPYICVETYECENLNCLAIIELEKFRPESIKDLRILLKKYRSVSFEQCSFISRSRNIEQLLICAEKAISHFRRIGMIDSNIAKKLRNSIESIAHFSRDQPLVLCHGDVSDSNLYCFEDEALLLDWEDCFWGFSGFDEVYYLSFLSNRFMICESSFKETGLEMDIAQATYALIVTLKEFIHLDSNQSTRQYSLVERLNFSNF